MLSCYLSTNPDGTTECTNLLFDGVAQADRTFPVGKKSEEIAQELFDEARALAAVRASYVQKVDDECERKIENDGFSVDTTGWTVDKGSLTMSLVHASNWNGLQLRKDDPIVTGSLPLSFKNLDDSDDLIISTSAEVQLAHDAAATALLTFRGTASAYKDQINAAADAPTIRGIYAAYKAL